MRGRVFSRGKDQGHSSAVRRTIAAAFYRFGEVNDCLRSSADGDFAALEKVVSDHSGLGPLVDVVMPGTSGPVLVARLRALRPGLRTVFISGYIDDAVTRHGVLESGEPFLQKPFTLTELADAVREALGRA